MDLNLFSLKVFLKVAECRSFTRAAEEMFLSQSAISLQIQKLEQLFQAQLLIRPSSGRVRLTPAGEAFRQHAEEMILVQGKIMSSMSKYSPVLQREICIGTCCIAGEHLIPLGMDAFRRAYPETSLSLSITKCQDVFDGVLQGKYHLGVVGLAPRSRSLTKTLLRKAPLLLFEARMGQQASRRISVRRLLDLRLVLREKGAGCRVELEKFISRHGVSPRNIEIVTESESNEAIIKLVKDGYGISALPDFMVRDSLRDGELSEIVLEEGQPLQSFYLIHLKQAHPSLLVRELFSSFRRHASQASATGVAR